MCTSCTLILPPSPSNITSRSTISSRSSNPLNTFPLVPQIWLRLTTVSIYKLHLHVLTHLLYLNTSDITHTHTQLFYCSSGISLGFPGWAGTRKVKTRKVKTNLDFLEQELVSGSGICWAICKSAPHPRQPRQHPTTHYCLQCFVLPSVLGRCWLGVRKGIQPVKKLSGGKALNDK